VSNDDQKRLEHLFNTVINIPSGAEQSTFLEHACEGDVDLRSQVESLLKAHSAAGSFLEVAPVDPDATVDTQAPRAITGTMIGRYKILQELGEGGFGTVYMAEQEAPVRRQVALKVIKLGMDTKHVIARFEAERQALALMDHLNIARVLDAGATETGRPYFVMELVKGITITAYCSKHRLSFRERLELFLPICQAVQHAHQKGIIHRDLKPNNVLVTIQDGKPVPKVIDFGIAKATSQRLTDKTLFTEYRQLLGTPEYMSPDQAEASGMDVDTRTDIYSLGVLLYELLTFSTPLDSTTLRKATFEEIWRIIREVEPQKPSLRVLTLHSNQADSTDQSSAPVDAAALSRSLRNDLDWIVMKALEKDRTRRYSTAKDLSDDIERYLNFEPVLAGPPSIAYRLRMFVRRHRLSVLAGSLVAAAIMIGLSLAAIGLVQANESREDLKIERDVAREARAEAEAQRALAVASAKETQKQAANSEILGGFLEDMLRSTDPNKALGRDLTVRYILDEAAHKLDARILDGQEEVEAAVRLTLGETYQALGLYDAAENQLQAAQAMFKRILSDEHAATLRASRVLAGLLRVTGRFTEAESLLRQTSATQSRILGEDHDDTLATMTELALALQGPGRFAEAEAIHRHILNIQLERLGAEHATTLATLINLGDICRVQGKTAEAKETLERAYRICQRKLGEEHKCTTRAQSILGQYHEDQRGYVRAERLYRLTYEQHGRILGSDHPQTDLIRNNLLRVLMLQHKTDALLPLLQERLSHLKRSADRHGQNHLAQHAYARELLFCIAHELQDAKTALEYAKRAVEISAGKDVSVLITLAKAYQRVGDLDQAITTQRRAIAQVRIGDPHNRTNLELKLNEYLQENGDLAGAALSYWSGWGKRLGQTVIPDSIPGAAQMLESETLMAKGKFEDAAELIRGCLAIRQNELPAGHWLIAAATGYLGTAMAKNGDPGEGERLLLDSMKNLDSNDQTPRNVKHETIRRIIQLYESWGKQERVKNWQQRLKQY